MVFLEFQGVGFWVKSQVWMLVQGAGALTRVRKLVGTSHGRAGGRCWGHMEDPPLFSGGGHKHPDGAGGFGGTKLGGPGGSLEANVHQQQGVWMVGPVGPKGEMDPLTKTNGCKNRDGAGLEFACQHSDFAGGPCSAVDPHLHSSLVPSQGQELWESSW